MNHLETLVSNITLNELAEKSGKSVAAIVEYAMNGKAKAYTAAVPAASASKKKTADTKEVDTRTPKGREAYDAQIFAALKARKDWTKAATLRAELGGSPLQMRTALNRLVVDGKVDYRGQARATEYKAS